MEENQLLASEIVSGGGRNVRKGKKVLIKICIETNFIINLDNISLNFILIFTPHLISFQTQLHSKVNQIQE